MWKPQNFPSCLNAFHLNLAQNEISADNGLLLRVCRTLPKVGEFDCDLEDLNEYFIQDAVAARALRLSETYELVLPSKGYSLLGLVSLSNDAILLNKIDGKCDVPDRMRYPFWPAVKIGRLGTQRELQGEGVGTFLLEMIKTMFTTNNRTGCRIITVDAYARKDTLRFYEKNHFQFLTPEDAGHRTRAMFFDLNTYQP